ncbi:hypothetical protein WAI453_010393 [Rhynchosporium graminicola]
MLLENVSLLPQTLKDRRCKSLHAKTVIMHLIRRSVARAASSSTASVRTINTSTPFALRSKTQQSSIISAIRKYSDDTGVPRSSDGENSAVRAAVESANENSSTPSSFNGGDRAYAPREPRQYDDRGGRPSYGDRDGGSRGRGGFGGRGGGRPSYGDRDGGRGGSYGGGRGGGFSGGRGGGYGGDRGGRGGMRDEGRGGGRSFGDRPAPVPSNGVYVGNLLFDVTGADIQKEFAEFGTITKCTLATDARGLSKGFAMIEFETIEQAAAAIEAKKDAVLEGRRLVVNFMNMTRRGNDAVENEPSKTLFIGNLAFEMSDADLNKLFRDIRNVIDVRVAIDRRTGQPRGFAHADFVDVESAIKGREALVGKEVYGRTLRIDYSAGSRDQRGDGGAPRGMPREEGESAY